MSQGVFCGVQPAGLFATPGATACVVAMKGVIELPLGASVELELIVEMES